MAEISVLMPVYNAQKYLTESLDSIRKQSFKDFEVLIVDDGSTDMSGQVCDQYAANDARFKVYHQKNSGGGVARNTALKYAMQSESKYIVWIDADDVVSNNYLMFLYTEIEKNQNYSIVQCGFSTQESDLDRCDGESKNSWSIENTEELLSEMQNGKHGMAFTVLWNKIYRKQVYQDVWVTINEQVSGKIYNDINILWKVYLNAKKCLVFDHVLYYYRYVPTSIQHKKITSRKLEFLPLYCEVYAECKKIGLNSYADFLSERMLFSLANNLGQPKKNYENYAKFYYEAKKIFIELQNKMKFKCDRLDLKALYILGSKKFIFFRIYGCLYIKMRKLKACL